MNYIVAHDRGPLSGISIEPAGRVYEHPIKCWVLDDGKKVSFARMRMGKLLDKYHVGGNFDTVALYGLSFDELCHILREQIGVSDDERYYQLVESINNPPKPKREPRLSTEDKIDVGSSFVLEALAFTAHVFLLGIKLIATLVLMPLLAAFFKRH
jgi:hypothetical protein